MVNLEQFIGESEHAAKATMLTLGGVPYDISIMMSGKRDIIHLPACQYFTIGETDYGVVATFASAGIGFAAIEGTDILAISLLAPGQMEKAISDAETGEEVSSRRMEAFIIIAIDVSSPGQRNSLVVSYEVVRAGGSADIFNREAHSVRGDSQTSAAVCPPLDAFLAGVALYKNLTE